EKRVPRAVQSGPSGNYPGEYAYNAMRWPPWAVTNAACAGVRTHAAMPAGRYLRKPDLLTSRPGRRITLLPKADYFYVYGSPSRAGYGPIARKRRHSL